MNKQKVILIYWLIIKFAEKIFANNADVDSNFSTANSHIYFAATNIIATFFIYIISQQWKSFIKLNIFIFAQMLLYIYFIFTALWSPMFFVSIGQAIYSFFGLLLSIIIAKSCIQNEDKTKNFILIIKLWSKLIILDYILSFIFSSLKNGLIMPSVDEKSLIAICIAILFACTSENINSKTKITLYWIYGMGQSLSAIIASVFIIIRYAWINSGKIAAGIMAIGISTSGVILFFLVDSGYLTIYGKSIEYLISGSGRFAVWEHLLDQYKSFDFYQMIFGHGYMSEREFLSTLDLPWAIDAHSNIIQSIYGVGLIGTALMLLIWIYPLMTLSKKSKFNDFNFKINKVIIASHISFIFFGLTSSHYFSRPSISAIFITSILLVVMQKTNTVKRIKNN